MAHLIAIAGPSAGKKYNVNNECVLGRSFNSDVYIGDLNVSRRHARIYFEQGQAMIEDMASGNGTFVDDQQVVRQRLEAGAVVRIGGSQFRYADLADQGAAALTVLGDLGHSPSDSVERLKRTLSLDPASAAAAAKEGAMTKSGIVDGLDEISSTPEQLAALSEGRATRMLEAMYAVADAVASELDLEVLFEKILEHLFAVFPQAERGFVMMTNATTGELVTEAVKQRDSSGQGVNYSQTVVNQVLSGGKAVIRGQTVPPTSETKAQPMPKMGAPLTCRDGALGTLHLEGRAGGSLFSSDDLALLAAIARQAALAIVNARTGQALLAQQRLEADLESARRIQRSFLPLRLPSVPNLSFETHYLPALHVGGDFYDIISLSPTRIGVLVGDISGKGVSAALLMAKVTSDIRLLSRSCDSPGDILAQANRSLIEAEQDAMFATVLYLMLDLKDNTFTIANAGHQPPIVCSRRFDGLSELDDATSVALGVVPEMAYPQEVYELVAGDVLVLYTDGINEALNRERKEYGMHRLRRALVSGPAEPAAAVSRIIADVHRFVGNADQSDDQTIVTFGRLS